MKLIENKKKKRSQKDGLVLIHKVFTELNNLNNQKYIKLLIDCGKRPGSQMVWHLSDTQGSTEHPGSIPGQGAHNSKFNLIWRRE